LPLGRRCTAPVRVRTGPAGGTVGAPRRSRCCWGVRCDAVMPQGCRAAARDLPPPLLHQRRRAVWLLLGRRRRPPPRPGPPALAAPSAGAAALEERPGEEAWCSHCLRFISADAGLQCFCGLQARCSSSSDVGRGPACSCGLHLPALLGAREVSRGREELHVPLLEGAPIPGSMATRDED